jgi:hypothetical protein
MRTLGNTDRYIDLRVEMGACYDTMRGLPEDGAYPVFSAVRGKISGDTEAFCKKHPGMQDVCFYFNSREIPYIYFFSIYFFFLENISKREKEI